MYSFVFKFRCVMSAKDTLLELQFSLNQHHIFNCKIPARDSSMYLQVFRNLYI